MRMMTSTRMVETGRWVLLSAALAAIVFLYLRLHASNPTIVALTFLLFILVVAANWSLRHAVVLSIAATACYNFFFLPPVGTFTVADPQNWLALLVFLTVSVIGSRLSQRARADANEARWRQREVELLLALSRELLQTDAGTDLPAQVPAMTAGIAHADSAALYLLDGDRLFLSPGPGAEALEMATLRHAALTLSEPQATEDSRANGTLIPLRAGVRPRGVMFLRGVSLSRETFQAIGSLISIALDRARALDALAAGEAAKQSERLRTLILDSITHDLRTPLTSIKGATSTLLDDPGIGLDDRVELLSIVDEETDRLDRLVSQAVEMAQLDARQVQMQKTPIAVEKIVQGACKASSGAVAPNRLSIALPRLPKILVDAELAEKALGNLLENAAKYSSPQAPIRITAAAGDEYVHVSVTDEGIGIAEEDLALVFERFYRVRSQTAGVSGTGMGLSISRAILESHGGMLRVESQLGKGSTFTASFPIA
jgi:two-component system sensor histidine kinase KdpD